MIPMAAGMIVQANHVPGITGGRQLPRAVYLDSFAGRIRHWGLGEGQSFAGALGYVPLPPAMAAKAQAPLTAVR